MTITTFLTKIQLNNWFKKMSIEDQKKQFSEYIIIALNAIVSKLKKKKIDCDFDLMFMTLSIIMTK